MHRWKDDEKCIFLEFSFIINFKKCEIKCLIQRNKRGDDHKRMKLNEMFKFLFTIILFTNLKIWYNYMHWLEKKSYKHWSNVSSFNELK